MSQIRASHIELEEDDLEETILSSVSSFQASEGVINSIGQYEHPTQKKWNLTPLMICAAFVASMCNLSRGFILAYSSPSIPELKANGLIMNEEEASWYGSFTPIGSLIGALVGGFVTHKYGRKISTMILCVPLSCGWLAIIAGDHIAWLYLGRLLTGMSNGMASLVASVYVSEVSSSNARGLLGTINQIATSVGVLACYTFTFFTDYKGLALFGAFNGALITVAMVFMPETPRWLISKGRTEEAVVNFVALRGCPVDVATTVVTKLDEEMAKQKKSLSLQEILKPEIMKPFGVSLLAMFFQQLSGIHVLLFYTQSIFLMVKFPDGKVATLILGVVMVIFYCFTPFLVDKAGRRVLMTISAIGISVSAAVLGTTFYITDNPIPDADVSYLPILALAATITYMASYSVGYGPIPWVLMGELIPLQARASVGGVATFVTWSLTFIVTKIFAPLQVVIGAHGVFWIFGGIALLAVVYVHTLLPETKGRTLEDIEFYFKFGKFPEKQTTSRKKQTSVV